jgi:predicted enzyme related to lactoylglutathione lyase
MNLSGLILFVQDVEKLKTFYMSFFHCTVIEEIKNEWVLLKAGNGEMGLHKAGIPGTDLWNKSNGENNNSKMVFECADNITLKHQEFLSNGISVSEIKSWEGYGFLLFDGADPEGNMFQIKQKK